MAEPVYEIVEDGPRHPYHILNPSPWPFLSSFAAGFMAVGAVIYMNSGSFLWLALGTLSVIACMIGWWREVIHEAVVEKAHTVIAKIGMRYGMLLFIASEVMFFVAFFWSYFNASLFPTDVVGGVWPPTGIETVDPFDLPLMLTLILLLSGCTVTWAHHAIMEGNVKDMKNALALTVGLGVIFTGFQAYEYAHVTFGFTDGVYASNFYMATGFHGFHVIVGTIFLAVCWWRAHRGHFTKESHFGFEAAAWYWHFVDVVWLFLFVSIYWWGA